MLVKWKSRLFPSKSGTNKVGCSLLLCCKILFLYCHHLPKPWKKRVLSPMVLVNWTIPQRKRKSADAEHEDERGGQKRDVKRIRSEKRKVFKRFWKQVASRSQIPKYWQWRTLAEQNENMFGGVKNAAFLALRWKVPTAHTQGNQNMVQFYQI